MDAKTYKGWDSTSGNIWRENRRFDPIWALTDCIMDTWQSKIGEENVDLRMRIPILQIANIKATIKRFEAKDVGESPSRHV